MNWMSHPYSLSDFCISTICFSATISIINSNSVLERWRLELKFVKFFMGQLWHTYCKSAGGKLPNPEAAPRKKRPLRLGHKSRQVYKVTTEDKVTNCESCTVRIPVVPRFK